MIKDNSTTLNAKQYDNAISDTLPYYMDFFEQTFEVVEQCGFEQLKWLDLGCGTGTLEEKALKRFGDIHFVLVDPSSEMLYMAKEKLKNEDVQYLNCGSDSIDFKDCFNVVTAIQSHHYMKEQERVKATKNVLNALKDGGIYICFENVIPDDESVKDFELARWGIYQIRHGKTEAEAKEHNARCGVNYYPITVDRHIDILRKAGFRHIHVFWYSYMQMGIYAIK
ncbi:MAG: class I SAM-dependent methyltransferase [Lachnospiraceae bacterium]|nr:class I SAM-dependent methyltransferase [Lachnospiraceae bacterium]